MEGWLANIPPNITIHYSQLQHQKFSSFNKFSFKKTAWLKCKYLLRQGELIHSGMAMYMHYFLKPDSFVLFRRKQAGGMGERSKTKDSNVEPSGFRRLLRQDRKRRKGALKVKLHVSGRDNNLPNSAH